jgi:hypothetical protein
VIRFVRAHGYDPGPTQRPFLAGAISGLLAAIPAGLVFTAFGSSRVAAESILSMPPPWAAALMTAGFTVGGWLYGAVFQRAANDRRAAWLLGMSSGFVLWIFAPIVVLPLVRSHAMAGGPAATGIFVGFLVWGLTVGLLFPYVHRPLQARLEGRSGRRWGPSAAEWGLRLLRRP